MTFKKTTEESSIYRHLDKMSTKEILFHINQEDKKVPDVIEQALPAIEELIDEIKDRMLHGGRLFYVGAGTSGRLGVLDASECPPTYGVSPDLVVGIMAGGDAALRTGNEEAEDSEELGRKDLERFNINSKDVVIGIAASGTTPYVIGALKIARKMNLLTGCVVCNVNSPVAAYARYPIELIVGPEFVTGSTRMKSGTAQKLVLNMISTTVMIGIGLVEDNQMVNMQISNQKLMDRGVKMLMKQTGTDNYEHAKAALLKYKSVKLAMQEFTFNQIRKKW